MLPASGPLNTVAIPEICPRELILLAMGCVQVRICGKQRVEIGHHAALLDETMEKFASRVVPTTWPLFDSCHKSLLRSCPEY